MERGAITDDPAAVAAAETGDKGLKKDAIGFLDGLAIGLDSTAPAYSLAAVIGSIVVAVGVYAPGVLLVSFVPMFLIAGAFFYMNRADPDCGTTFSWVTRAMGPWLGWIGGWAIFTTGVLVIVCVIGVAGGDEGERFFSRRGFESVSPERAEAASPALGPTTPGR